MLNKNTYALTHTAVATMNAIWLMANDFSLFVLAEIAINEIAKRKNGAWTNSLHCDSMNLLPSAEQLSTRMNDEVEFWRAIDVGQTPCDTIDSIE